MAEPSKFLLLPVYMKKSSLQFKLLSNYAHLDCVLYKDSQAYLFLGL